MQYYIIWGFLHIAAWLPLPLLHGIGHVAGNLLNAIPNRLRTITMQHIRQCLPELTGAQQRRLVHASLIETVKTLTETGVLWLRPGPRALHLIRTVDGRELVDAALKKGRGVILATPHLGSWEAAGIRTMYRTLEEGGTAALLPDQEPRPGSGIFAPFFGIPAWSGVLLARMARRTGAPVIFAWCERLPRGRGYHLHFRAAPQGIDDADLEVAAGAMNRAVEQLVRECPQQYQWGYRRFKRRPAGEAPFYPNRQQDSE
jgi:KDO2-lipid IV(A) lauroyltransferase